MRCQGGMLEVVFAAVPGVEVVESHGIFALSWPQLNFGRYRACVDASAAIGAEVWA